MPTVREYYKTNFSFLSGYHVESTMTAVNESGMAIQFEKTTIWDFNANARFVAFYFPADIGEGSLLLHLLDQIRDLSDKANNVGVGRRTPAGPVLELKVEDGDAFGIYTGPGEKTSTSSKELCFTGRVFFYTEQAVSDGVWVKIDGAARSKGMLAMHRGPEYAAKRDYIEKPRAFISHDFWDQETIARPIATRLRSMSCPVWYSEFSLRVGQSLRTSIEKGLKECHMCVLLLTSTFFLKADGRSASMTPIFTRELVEERELILPVWAGVTQAEVFEYGPVLADRYALQWQAGEEEVCRKLYVELSA